MCAPRNPTDARWVNYLVVDNGLRIRYSGCDHLFWTIVKHRLSRAYCSIHQAPESVGFLLKHFVDP